MGRDQSDQASLLDYWPLLWVPGRRGGRRRLAPARRRQEVGIRIALGATRTRIVIQMLRQATMPVFAGIFVGMLGALGLTRLTSGYLYEVRPTDPAAFALAGKILTVTALVAACLPLTRATAVEPVTALRHR